MRHLPVTGVKKSGISSPETMVRWPDRTRTGSMRLSGSALAGVNSSATDFRPAATYSYQSPCHLGSGEGS